MPNIIPNQQSSSLNPVTQTDRATILYIELFFISQWICENREFSQQAKKKVISNIFSLIILK